MKHGPELGFDDDGRPVLITAAAPAYEEQHRERVRKYLTIMAFRIPALILAAVAYGIWENGLVSLAIIVAVDSAAVDRRSHRERPAAAARRGAPTLRSAAHTAVPDRRTPRARAATAAGAATRRWRSDGRRSFLSELSSYSQTILRPSGQNRRSTRVNPPVRGNSSYQLGVEVLDSSSRAGGPDGECHFKPLSTKIWTLRVQPLIWCACT